MASAENKDNSSHIFLDDSSLKTNATIEDLKLAWKTSRKIKKQKQREAAEQKDKGSCHLLDNSSLKTDTTTKEVNSSGKKKKKKKKKQGEAVEHKDKGPHFSVDNSSVKADAIIEDLELGCNQSGAKKKNKQCEAVGLKDKVSQFSQNNSSLNTDATIKDENSLQKQKRERKKKNQGKAIGPSDKGSRVSLDNSSLKTDATNEVNLSRKRKRQKKNKNQGKAIEHKGPHLPVDNSSLKTDATSKEVSSSEIQKAERKKKKQGKAAEHKKGKGSHVSLDNSSLKTDVVTEELNSSRKRKRERKKKKQGKAIEHKPEGSPLLVDNSSLKTDSTIEDPLHEPPAPTLLDSQETVELGLKKKNKKRKRKKAKHHDIENIVNSCGPPNDIETDIYLGENEEKEHVMPQKVAEHSNVESDNQELYCSRNIVVANAECSAKESVLEVVELDKEHGIIDSNSNHMDNNDFVKEKKKKRKRKKTKHHAIENTASSCGAPIDTFSSKTSIPALHRPAEHPIQFVSTDPVTGKSCVETVICQGENEEKEQLMPKKVVENNNVECDVQELSCSRNTVVANVDCSAKESVLEVVELNKEHGIIDSSSNHKDSSGFVKNANPAKSHDNSAVQHMPETFQSHKTYTSTERVNSNHGRNSCHPSPVLQLEEANGRQLDSIDTTRNDMCCAAGDVPDLSLVSRTGGQSEIPHLTLGRTITCKHYSKNKLLILDVNGLLADFAGKVPKGSKPPDIYINEKKVYKRPFCDDFINFCLNKFHVGVWSSRVKRNLDKAIRFLFGRSASKLLFCWNQSHCTKTKSFTLEDKHKPLVFKDIRKLWDKTVSNLPWEKGEFNESNTLLLDDSPYKALLNPRYSAIFPHSYHFTDTGDRSLARDGDLRVYLKRLAMAENVQEYVSSNPFGQEPITETSPSWDFYSKIIEAVKHRQNDAVKQATSSRQRSRNQSSTATDQGTAGQPPSAVGAPPQQTEAPPPLTTGDPPQQTEAPLPPATSDPPQQTGALPPPATVDPPRQTKALLPTATRDPAQQSKVPLPPATATTAIPP